MELYVLVFLSFKNYYVRIGMLRKITAIESLYISSYVVNGTLLYKIFKKYVDFTFLRQNVINFQAD